MSDASSVALRYIAEATWGDIPASALTNLRFSNENFEGLKAAIESDEIVSDAQVADLIAAGYSSQGTVNGELSFETYDDFISAAIRSTDFAAENTDTGTTFAATTTGFTDSGSGFVSGGLAVGDFVKFSGFTQNSGENNGWYLCTAVAAGTLTTYPAPAAAETAGDSVTWASAAIENGTQSRSFTFERENTDLSNVFSSWSGCRVASWELAWVAEDKVTMAFSFLGKKEVPAAATVGTGGPTAATTSKVMNASSDLQYVGEGTSMATVQVIGVSMTVNTGARNQPISASTDPYGIGLGRVRVTGQVRLYFADNTLKTKFTADTETALAFGFQDADGSCYGVYLPRVKLSAAPSTTPGNEQDVELVLSFTALKDSTTGKTIHVSQAA